MHQCGGGAAFSTVGLGMQIGNFFKSNISRRRPQHHQSNASKFSSKLCVVERDGRSLSGLVPKAIDLAAEADKWKYPNAAPPTFTGIWKKDKAASDSMQEACDLIALPWVFRQAMTFLNTLQVEETEEHFTTIMKAGGIMDVTETYPWTGEKIALPRRDKRRGKHVGRVLRLEEGAVCIEAKWEHPYGGWCTETFILSNNMSTLEQISEMKMDETGKECTYRTVYKRA